MGSTSQLVIRIIEVLTERTDREHGIALADLCQEVGASEKTVRAHLKMLTQVKPFGRTVGRLTRSDLAHAESPDSCVGWYIEPVLDSAEARLLADSLALSRINADSVQNLLHKLQALGGRGADRGSLAIDQLETPEHYNAEFLVNIEKLNEAIRADRVVEFRYCHYGANGELVPRVDAATGRAKRYRVDPYQMFYKNGRYYLLCHMHAYRNLSYLHVDRIRKLVILGDFVPRKHELNSFAKPGEEFDVSAHMAERPYPMGGEPVTIRMRVTCGSMGVRREGHRLPSLDPIFDWFPNPQVRQIGDEMFEVTVCANEKATLWWALQYADEGLTTIEILEPQSLREELCRTGKRLAQRYA